MFATALKFDRILSVSFSNHEEISKTTYMIKTVIFDLGNVILPFDVSRLANRLARYSPFSANDIIIKLWSETLAEVFETGQMDPKTYFDHINKECQFSDLTLEAFLPIFNDIFEEDLQVTAILTELKKSVKLGLISNTNPIHSEYISKSYEVMGHFDKVWFSNEVGIRKPNPKIYILALEFFGIKPTECVFVDDMEINIQSAKDLGIKALHYSSPDRLKEDLATLGFNFNKKVA